MDQGAGGATEASLTPQPAPEVSGGILHAGRGFIGNAGITLIGAVAGAVLTTGNEVLAARFLGVSAYGLYALTLMLAKSGEIIAAFGSSAASACAAAFWATLMFWTVTQLSAPAWAAAPAALLAWICASTTSLSSASPFHLW